MKVSRTPAFEVRISTADWRPQYQLKVMGLQSDSMAIIGKIHPLEDEWIITRKKKLFGWQEIAKHFSKDRNVSVMRYIYLLSNARCILWQRDDKEFFVFAHKQRKMLRKDNWCFFPSVYLHTVHFSLLKGMETKQENRWNQINLWWNAINLEAITIELHLGQG